MRPFIKITIQDIEIAEEFFEKDSHLKEFLWNVIQYYRGATTTFRFKIVQRYFNTYKKTMDFVISSAKHGTAGGLKKADNQQVAARTLEGVLLGGVAPIEAPLVPLVEPPLIPNNKVISNKDKYKVKKKKEPSSYDSDSLIIDYFSKEMINPIKEWTDYKKVQFKFVNKGSASFKMMLTELLKLSKGDEMVAEEIIVQSMANGWKGFFELKQNNNKDEKREQLSIAARQIKEQYPNL